MRTVLGSRSEIYLKWYLVTADRVSIGKKVVWPKGGQADEEKIEQQNRSVQKR